ncbi:MAG: metallophosphoesterase family protein [Parachlamydiaceae bacterium]|nr:metallophosphoesterase family protein [Parachlamydiaceae bacterium]
MKYFIKLSFLFLFTVASASAELFDPVALFLTWQRDPAHTMTVVWITRPDVTTDEVDYYKEGSSEGLVQIGTHRGMPNGHPYYIHQVELTNLEPNSDYLFRIHPDGALYKFRTMPTDLKKPVRFIVGGDVYGDTIESVIEMNREAAKKEPSFALVGGDLAYSAPSGGFFAKFFMHEKPDRWLAWLVAWKEHMVTPKGRLIPLIPAIGNHETVGGDKQTPEEARFFYALFPMPGKQGYNVLDFGNYLSLILLDTGHTHPIRGEQTNWLAQTLQERATVLNKFALYHEGAYPSYRSPRSKNSRTIRQHWIPLFEQYGLNAAFENHDHAYKRTHPIKEDKIDPQGVLYIGDGCWGVKPRETKERWYLAKTASQRHVVLVTLTKDKTRFAAIDAQGDLIDEFSQKHKGRR